MRRWARFVSQTPWLWLIAWPVAAAAIWVGSPRIQALLQDDATEFLPPDMPSMRASSLLRQEFPEFAPRSRAALIITRSAGLTPKDLQLIDDISNELSRQTEKWGWRVHSYATDPHLATIYRSPDGQAALVVVDLPASPLTHSSVNRVRQVQSTIRPVLANTGLDSYITGSAALGELLDANAKKSVDRTTMWAFLAVMVILLLIYRSPVAMLLPIATIATALLLALGLVGWAAAYSLPVNGLVEMFVVVILVGSGVDYCLFLFSRFREELAHTTNVRLAVERSITKCGGAILASAGTNAAALATLALARNRDLYTSGPTIAGCICIATLAVLTLTPALMRIAGTRLFWPFAAEGSDDGRMPFWQRVGQFVVRRPVVAALFPVALLTPPVVLGIFAVPVYDAYHEFPSKSDFVRGAAMYEHHYFGVDEITELTLIVSGDAPLRSGPARAALPAALDEVASALKEEYPIVYIRDLADPLGDFRISSETNSRGWLARIKRRVASAMATDSYIGRSGHTTRIEVAMELDPRAIETMELLPELRAQVRSKLAGGPLGTATATDEFTVRVAGDTPLYADMRSLRYSDFRVVATAAVLVVFAVLFWLLRSVVQSVLLIAATLLTYIAAYGLAWAVSYAMFGFPGLNWQIDFIFFIVILSLGQDYNIFVVTRIQEERKTNSPTDAVSTAVWRTGRVVSSCGIIMGATFASMLSGSLIVMKQFAIAFSLGVLLDSFVIRPLVVPAVILLLDRDRRKAIESTRSKPDDLTGASYVAASDG